MDTMMSFAVLGMATLAAVFAAVGLNWLLLRWTFALMRPAAVRSRVTVAEIERGTRLAARAYGQVR